MAATTWSSAKIKPRNKGLASSIWHANKPVGSVSYGGGYINEKIFVADRFHLFESR